MGKLTLFFIVISLYAQERPKPHPNLGKRLSSEHLKTRKKFGKNTPKIDQVVGIKKNRQYIYGQVVYKNDETIAVSTTSDWSKSQTCIGQPYQKRQLRKLSS